MSKALEGFLLQLLRARLDPFTAGIADVIRKGRAAGLPEDITRQALNEICTKVYNEQPTTNTPPPDTQAPLWDEPTAPRTRLSRKRACEMRTLVATGAVDSYQDLVDKFGVKIEAILYILCFDTWPRCCTEHIHLNERVDRLRPDGPSRSMPRPLIVQAVYERDPSWRRAYDTRERIHFE